MNKTIGVIGAGGWGIALATVLAEKGEEPILWCHGQDSFQELQRTRASSAYLPGIVLPVTVSITRSLAEAVAGRSLIICAVPSHAVREVMAQAASHCGADCRIVCATKGLEEESLKTMGEVLDDIFGASRPHAFLSGPTFALEVARGLPAAVTVACHEDTVAKLVQETLRTPNFRVYTSRDVIGVQMGGVVKNIIAIAAGISDGLGLGQNARAALITRGLAEMTRLATRMGADPLTLAGLPGLGDMVLTCSGDLSRNRQVGLAIAQGQSLQQIVAGTKTVAEGVRNTRSVFWLSRRLQVEMPIVEQMFHVLYGNKKAADAVRDLLLRSLKAENW
ncbi:MAG TPA: NAD(P)H-dependent glycerol-3-phosphate dehydrogenase [Candidatus Binatia bacterium]|nr:NAD(P)H-dependent glycerol-3-phosphate dehydrogenase [Candidatus Binatia bacterium]